jgi:hypothetical protein
MELLNRKQSIAFIITLIALLANKSFASQIGTGFSTKKASFWRYWEKTDNGYDQKILILNISKNPIKLHVKEILKRGYALKTDSTKTIIIQDDVLISPFQYYILNLDTNIINQTTHGKDELRILKFYINDKSAGAISSDFELPPQQIQGYSYISPVGINGAFSMYWIAKNNLFTSEHNPDSILLVNKYIGNPIFRDNEQYSLYFTPSMQFSDFSTITNGKQKFKQDFFGSYQIRIPNFKDNIDHITSEITIKYTLKKDDQLFLGINCKTYVMIQSRNDKKEEFTDYASRGYMIIPILMIPEKREND